MSQHRYALLGFVALSLAVFSAARAEDSKSIEPSTSKSTEGPGPSEEKAPAQKPTDSTGEKPTHKQSALIQVNAEGLSQSSVQCFCLMSDDVLLAGCKGSANEIRVFDGTQKYVKSLPVEVTPEAINVAQDDTILVAGEGKLFRLDKDGKTLSQSDAPHATALRDSRKKLRDEVIEQQKQQRQMLPQMLKSYDEAMKNLEDQIKQLGSDESSQETKKQLEESLNQYKEAKEQLADQFPDKGDDAELTDEKIEQLIESSIQYKMTAASISATKDAVYLATKTPVGYGFDVWRMNPDFGDAKKIVTGLSGCCGQMDVQANSDGVFIAENSRKRVRRVDADGKSICDWGKASEGVNGFGSCCNPMNLAFGANGAVYTAEDTTGRIKQYSPDGKLLSVVGAADVVPGCKKVSIGVSSKGDRVYMLDITRNTVAVLSRVLPDPSEPLADAKASSGGGILSFFGLGD